jgi:hypothetical protein
MEGEAQITKKKRTRTLDHLPSSVDLVPHLPEPKVSLDRVPQCPAFIARAASVDDYDDVLQATREIRVPVDVERSAHKL